MLICPECFNDTEIQAEIRNNIIDSGKCEVSGLLSDLADLSILQDFFDELLSLFEPCATGKPIIAFLEEWNLFADSSIAKIILHDALIIGGFPYSENSPVNYKPDILEGMCIWENLKHEVREKTRFFADTDPILSGGYLKPAFLLQQNEHLYRARVIPQGRNYLTKADMCCPLPKFTKAGRANPIGIPYLYLCQDYDTTYYEVRALHMDRLTIGTFEVQRDLKIVDFSTDANLFIAYSAGVPIKEVIIEKKLNESIRADMSKPLRRYDSELEYVPTQLICEFCKLELSADGIRFNSSLHEGGVNYVLFHKEDAKCIKVCTHQIGSISIKKKN